MSVANEKRSHPASTPEVLQQLLLQRGGGQPMPDGREQQPGGWNRFAIPVDDLQEMVIRLRQAGAVFRNDIVIGVGGKQNLLEEPSGNPIELFQPLRPEARLDEYANSAR
jgi:hypothetical protein